MTISFRAYNGLAAGTDTSAAWTMPTGHTLDDFLLAIYAGKPYDASVTSGTFTTDYTSLSDHANGTVANGVDTGSVRLQCAWRQHDGSESAPTGTVSATPSPRMTAMLAVSKTEAGVWDVVATDADDTDATGTSISCTGSAISLAPNDLLLWVVAGPSDITMSSTAFSASGITFGALTLRSVTHSTTTGNDGLLRVYSASVSSGTATVAPTATTTAGTSGFSSATSAFIRLREPAVSAGNRFKLGTALRRQAAIRAAHL